MRRGGRSNARPPCRTASSTSPSRHRPRMPSPSRWPPLELPPLTVRRPRRHHRRDHRGSSADGGQARRESGANTDPCRGRADTADDRRSVRRCGDVSRTHHAVLRLAPRQPEDRGVCAGAREPAGSRDRGARRPGAAGGALRTAENQRAHHSCRRPDCRNPGSVGGVHQQLVAGGRRSGSSDAIDRQRIARRRRPSPAAPERGAWCGGCIS